MRLPYKFLTLMAASLVAAACGHKPPPEQPTPVATVDTAAANARARARQDSIDAANRARARADSIARAEADRRAAADRAARDRDAVMGDVTAMVHFDFDKALMSTTWRWETAVPPLPSGTW